jgi:hypothetical protein
MYTLLNLNRTDDRKEIYTPCVLRRVKFVDTHSSASPDQVMKNGGFSALYIFQTQAVWEKPYVSERIYRGMTPDERAENATLDFNTYVVEGQITGETTIEAVRANFNVWKVEGWENKRMGSELARHIKVLLK